MKKLLVLPLVVLALAGCSKRQIDPVKSGSVNVPGTSWQRFCDGPNAVIWIPGRNGEDDELEAYIYDHWACVKDGDKAADRPHDEDGISEDEK